MTIVEEGEEGEEEEERVGSRSTGEQSALISSTTYQRKE
jgi:hypothetical protein